MFSRIRSISLAGGGAMALVLALSGVVAAATVMTALASPAADPVPVVVDTTATFEDLDGNGVDDDCQTEVVADETAAADAEKAADLNGDGIISVSEAAQTGRIGGKHCNHGGYVSSVAQGEEAPDADEDADEGVPVEDEAPVECDAEEPVPADEADPIVDPAPNAHGKAVSEVAKSDAVGGKNCNHGGAVSDAAKKDHEAAKAARDTAKAAREAARLAAKESREAARAAAGHGKKHGR